MDLKDYVMNLLAEEARKADLTLLSQPDGKDTLRLRLARDSSTWPVASILFSAGGSVLVCPWPDYKTRFSGGAVRSDGNVVYLLDDLTPLLRDTRSVFREVERKLGRAGAPPADELKG